MTYEELKFCCWCVIIGALSILCLIDQLGLIKNENSKVSNARCSKEA